MNANPILDAVVDYVRTPQTDYALLITGPWGCGKTYFWKNVVEPELRKRCIGDAKCRPLYASLYGCQSAKDVDTQLFLASYPHLQKKWTTRLASVGGNFGNKLLKVFTRFELPAIDLRWLVRTKNAVLCFDDLERTQLPMKEALGYINTFVEHEGVKVIVLCNEDAISDDGGDKKTYQTMKEKIVGASLGFRADLDVVFETLMSEHQTRPEFRKFLVTNRALLRRLFDRSKTHNIRSLRRALSALAVIFEALQSQRIDPNKLAEQLIYVVAPGSFELHGRGVEPDKLRELLGEKNMAIAGWVAGSRMKDEEGATSEDAFKAEFSERYFDGIGFAEWRMPVGCPPVCEFLLTGVLDRPALADWARELIKPPDERDARIKRLTWDPRDMENDEFADAVQRTIEEVANGDIPTIGSYFGLYQRLEWFCDVGLIALSRKDLMQKFTGGLAKAQERGILAPEPRLRSAIEHPSLAPTTDEQRALAQRVSEVNEQLLQGRLRERTLSLMSRLKDDPERFINALTDDGEESLAFVPVFHQLPIDEVASELSRMSNTHKVQFLRALHQRYERHAVASEFAVELPALEQLRDALNGEVPSTDERPVTMGTHLIRDVVKTLDKVISRLRPAASDGAAPAADTDAQAGKEDGDDDTK